MGLDPSLVFFLSLKVTDLAVKWTGCLCWVLHNGVLGSYVDQGREPSCCCTFVLMVPGADFMKGLRLSPVSD